MRNEWHNQQEANIIAFLEDSEEYGKRRQFFFQMCEAFERENVNWNLFCSSSLFFLGITDDFNDFDILIEKGSIDTAVKLLRNLGMRIEREEMYGFEIDSKRLTQEEIESLEQLMGKATQGKFVSNRYIDFISPNKTVEVDMISGFRVGAMNTQFLYEYSPNEIEHVNICNFNVPVVCPEAQFVLYAMMECWQSQRRFKRKLIKQYIEDKGVNHPEVLNKALQARIPYWIKKKIREILSS